MVQHIDQILSVAVAMRGSSQRLGKLKGIIDIAAVMEDCAPGPNHRKTMESLRKTQNVDRLARATAVSRRQVPTIQTVQKSLKMLTEFKPFTQVPACVGDHEVSVDAFAEWLKAISEGGQRNRPV